MATVTKRTWPTKAGEAKTAWKVDYKDARNKRCSRQFERKKDADAFRQQVEDELRRGTHVAARATMTVSTAWTSYQAKMEHEHKLGQLSGTYVESQRHYAEQNVLPEFGRLKLTEITTKRVQKWADEMRVRPRPDGIGPYKTASAGDPYSRRTVERMVNVIQGILDHAVGEGWLARSPLRDYRVKVAPERLDVDPEYPMMEDLQALLDTLNARLANETYSYWRTKRVLFTLLLFGGMRRAEAVALQWENVDFERREIRLRHGYNKVDGLRRPKTKAGRRTIPMVDQVYEVLRWQAKECGYATGFVLRTRDGAPLYGTTISGSWWRKLMKAAGLLNADGKPRFTVHKLRYATVARMLAQGLPMFETAKLVGHKDLRMIMQVYGYVLDTATIRAAMDKDAAQLPVGAPQRALPSPPPQPLALPDPSSDGPVIEGTAVVVATDAVGGAGEPPEGMTRRRLAITLWQQGLSLEAAGARVGVCEAAVHQWIRRAEELGPEAGAAWLDRPDPIGTVGTTWDDLKVQARALWAEGVPMKEIARQLNVSLSICYRWVKEPPAVVRRATKAKRAAPREAGSPAGVDAAAGEKGPAPAQLALFGDAA